MNLLTTSLRVIFTIALVLGMSSQAVNAWPSAHININQANATQIAGRVPGIGIKRAEAIVKYRHEHGPFANVADIAKVKGLSDKFVSKHSVQLGEQFTV